MPATQSTSTGASKKSPLRKTLTTGFFVGVVTAAVAIFTKTGNRSVEEMVGIAVIYVGIAMVTLFVFQMVKFMLPNDGKVFGFAAFFIALALLTEASDWASWLIYAEPVLAVFAIVIDNAVAESRREHERVAVVTQLGRIK